MPKISQTRTMKVKPSDLTASVLQEFLKDLPYDTRVAVDVHKATDQRDESLTTFTADLSEF